MLTLQAFDPNLPQCLDTPAHEPASNPPARHSVLHLPVFF